MINPVESVIHPLNNHGQDNFIVVRSHQKKLYLKKENTNKVCTEANWQNNIQILDV